MDLQIRSIQPEEYPAWVAAVASAFGEYPRREWLEVETKVLEPDRTLAVLDGDRIVAGSSNVSLQVTVPGGVVPMAGLTGVGVAPTHRRRGLGTALMQRQMEEVRDRGLEPLSGLWASESHIYPRFGYGVAAPRLTLELDREHASFAVPHRDRGNVRLLDRSEAFAAFEAVYEQVRTSVPGMIERKGVWWDVRFLDSERERDGASEYFFALHESPEGPDAYTVYRVKHHWPDSGPANEVQLEELVAATTDAYASIWRFVLDLDLVAKVDAWNRPVDEPLWFMVAEPRRLNLTLRDGLWLHLVDIGVALAARRYAVEGALTVEVRDAFCPWNEGRYRVEGGPDGATCDRVRTAPDLVLEVGDLSAGFLGWPRFGPMLRAGRISEETNGAVARADTMFAHDPAPWCPHAF
jgi:predicted acetyltransferase